MRSKLSMLTLAALMGTALFLMAACQPGGGGDQPSGEAVKLHGAGATFPKPVYDRWMYQYQQEAGTEINYEGIGSGGGQKAIKAKTVDFAGSDAPMGADELDAEGLIQFPMIVGGIVPVLNIEGIDNNELRLDADTLGRIFAGGITRWNDPAIAALNDGLDLPDEAIRFVHRADGSGTTWTITWYLHNASDYWRQNMQAVKTDKETGEISETYDISYGKSIRWPEGTLGANGNDGVAGVVKETPYSIGYVEYAYALQAELTTIQMQNRDGNFVNPTLDTFAAAAENVDWAGQSGEGLVPVHQHGSNTWPIVGVSFILIHKEQEDAAKTDAMLKYFDWSFNAGGAAARELHYVPIPNSVADMVRNVWKNEVTAGGEAVWQ